MLRIMRDVETARCRVVKWKLTDAYAKKIAAYMSFSNQQAMNKAYAELISGNGYLLGAKVEVKG